MIPQSEKRKPGRRRINIESDRDVIYWSSKLNCSPELLISIVKQAGPSPIRVARELEKRVEAS